jgi:hypothetical protein
MLTSHARRHLKQEYPFWNRTQGRDHVLWVPNDRGSCYFDSTDPDLDNLMVITHFGLHQAPGNKLQGDTMNVPRRDGCINPVKDVVAPGNKGLLGPAANRTFGEQGRKEFDAPKEVTVMFVGGFGGASRPPPGCCGCFTASWHALQPRFVCKRRPLLTCQLSYTSATCSSLADLQPAALLGDAASRARAGGVREDDLSYSGGVRQEVYHLWGNNNEKADPGSGKVVVYKGYHGRYEWLVKNSKFCLAPYGWGWGIRISEVCCCCCCCCC